MTIGPRIGSLRHRLMLEAPQRISDAAGGVFETWTSIGQVWAEVTPITGNETFAADRIVGRVTHSIAVRARSDLSPAQRLRLGDRIFEIRAVLMADHRHHRMRLICEERDL